MKDKKKAMTKKKIKQGYETISLKKETISLIKPFFDMDIPARKVAMRSTDLQGNKVKMPGINTILKYFNVWKMEHTYLIRDDLAKHQRVIKAKLVDNYEEIILKSVILYNKNEKWVDENKDDIHEDKYWYPKMLAQLTDHNTLIGELIASKARLEMAPFIDQTSEDAIKKKLEQDIEHEIIALKEAKEGKGKKK